MGDDIKDMFHTFPLAVLQCDAMGLLRLDPLNLTEESIDAALCAVQARCLEMGVAPSSNWAQRFLTECNHGFSKRFARANEPLMRELEQLHPKFAAWREARRELSKRTGRDEAAGHWLTGYTDDCIALVLSAASMVLYLCMHAEHYGPRGLNMRMAIAAKRSLGVAAKFIGGLILTTGALAYVDPEKMLRTDAALIEAIEGRMLLADWVRLVGLLNHLVCLLLLPYHIMYDVYDISDACRAARRGPDEPIITTPKGIKALRKWLEHVRNVAGTSALSAAFALRRAGISGLVHALRSDAAILGTGKPALCGNLYQHVYILSLVPRWLAMPIVVLEFLGGLINDHLRPEAEGRAVRAAARRARRADGDGGQGQGADDALPAPALPRPGRAARPHQPNGGDGVRPVQRDHRRRLARQDGGAGGDHERPPPRHLLRRRAAGAAAPTRTRRAPAAARPPRRARTARG